MTARAEAWFAAMDTAGIAEADEASVTWREPPRVIVDHIIRAVPLAPGAIPLVVGWNHLEDAGWPAVVLGVGDPAEFVTVIPDCACDACDSGSQDALDELDEYLLGVVTGTYRKLWRGKREITVYSEDHTNWSGFERHRVNLWRLLPGRFVGFPTAASPPLFATDYYYTTKSTNYQGKPRWLYALRRAVADKLGNDGSRYKKSRQKIEKVLAHPKRWHQLHGSPWLDDSDHP